MEILLEILEEVFELLITSPRIPKPLRYILLTAVAGFVMAIGLLLVIQGGGLAGSLMGAGLIALAIGAGIYLGIKIHRS